MEDAVLAKMIEMNWELQSLKSLVNTINTDSQSISATTSTGVLNLRARLNDMEKPTTPSDNPTLSQLQRDIDNHVV